MTSASSLSTAESELAIHGGSAVRTTPWPARQLFGQDEKAAAMRLFDQAIASGHAFGYNGPEEEAYCQAFAQWLGGGYADSVNSGTSSVYVALRSLDLEPFTEVIVPPITDPGGVMPVALLNCIPVPADTAPGQLNTNAEEIAKRITPRTSAILVAHIAGHPCDMDPIMALAREHGLRVVEDCAQAHGAMYKGKPVGTMGDVSAFSTMSGKHHATAAQGGVVFTRDENIHWRSRQAADRGKPFGVKSAKGNVLASLNLNNNELACAVGRVQLAKLPSIISRRQIFARQVIEGARKLTAMSFVEPLPETQSVYWFLVAKVDVSRLKMDKDTFAAALAAEGIPAAQHYWHCPVEADWYTQRRVFGTSGYPWAHSAETDRVWTVADLPHAQAGREAIFPIHMHENCSDREVRDILEAAAKVEAAYLA